MQEFILEVMDTQLFCRKYGENRTPLVMVHGAATDADFFHDAASLFSRDYTVYTYDRRGYGRNEEVESHKLTVQINDLHTLICKITLPCNIVAHSAGAILAMLLVAEHPEDVEKLVLYEPIVKELILKDTEYNAIWQSAQTKIEEKKYASAITLFLSLMGEKDKRARASTDAEVEHMAKNCLCFVKKEFELFGNAQIPYEKISRASIAIGVGEKSHDKAATEIAETLSNQFQCRLTYYPGGHNCPYDLPREFYYMTKSILEDKNIGGHS